MLRILKVSMEDCVGFIELEHHIVSFMAHILFLVPLAMKGALFTVNMVPLTKLLLLSIFNSSKL